MKKINIHNMVVLVSAVVIMKFQSWEICVLDVVEGIVVKMTVRCIKCGIIPQTYIVIDDKPLCMKCRDIQYEFALQCLNEKYGK